MRITKRSRTRGGFTLTELMITVALIGMLAAIAIPNFMTYQARTRRSEGFTNLAGIARAYKIYHAERGRYPDMTTDVGRTPSLPAPGAGQPEHGEDALGRHDARPSSASWAGGPMATSSTATKSSPTACGGGCTDQTLLHRGRARRRRRRRRPRRGDVRAPADGRRGHSDRVVSFRDPAGYQRRPFVPGRASPSTTSPPSI